MAFPLAYGIAQGCVYTHSAWRYLGRLLLLPCFPGALPPGPEGRFPGLWPFLVFSPCWRGRLPDRQILQEQGQALGLGGGGPVAAIVLLCEILGTDYGGFGCCAFAAYRSRRQARPASSPWARWWPFSYCGEQLQRVFLAPVVGGHPAQFWYMAQQAVFALAGVGLVALYNGQPGSKRGKWVFYVFYPAHLLALWLLRAAADLTIFYLEGGFS
ncbi:MAG: TraX family protein [Acutalibacter sp.]